MKRYLLTLAALLGALIFGGTLAMSAPQSQPTIQYVVFHKPGPNWKPGVDFREQPGVRDHITHYAKLNQDGRLFLGGPFLDSSGGMMVAAPGETLESITEFATNDPAVKSGLLIFEVKPWMIAMQKAQ